MKSRVIGSIVAAAAGLCGCSMDEGMAGSAASSVPPATAEARTADGTLSARAMAMQEGDSIRIRVEAMGLPRGTYGAHVHMTGACAPPAFTSAGPHWNPTGQEHGRNNPRGMHKGDLPNLEVGTDGRGSFEYMIPGAWLRAGAMPMLDADGAAIVIHAAADDYRTDPAGNAGARMACGVFR